MIKRMWTSGAFHSTKNSAKFRNGDLKWYEKLLRKFLENPKIVEINRKFRQENQTQRKFLVRNLGIPRARLSSSLENSGECCSIGHGKFSAIFQYSEYFIEWRAPVIYVLTKHRRVHELVHWGEIWILSAVEWGKLENTEKDPRSKEEPRTKSIYLWRWIENLNPAHNGGRRPLSLLHYPCSTM